MADAPHLLVRVGNTEAELTEDQLSALLTKYVSAYEAAVLDRDELDERNKTLIAESETARRERDKYERLAAVIREGLRASEGLREIAELERDAARAALRAVQTYTHAFHSIGPRAACTEGICAKVRASLGESAGQDGG